MKMPPSELLPSRPMLTFVSGPPGLAAADPAGLALAAPEAAGLALALAAGFALAAAEVAALAAGFALAEAAGLAGAELCGADAGAAPPPQAANRPARMIGAPNRMRNMNPPWLSVRPIIGEPLPRSRGTLAQRLLEVSTWRRLS